MTASIINLVGSKDPHVLHGIFDHLFGSTTKFEFRRLFPDFAESKIVWDKVNSNGYLMQNCKLFAWAAHRDKRTRPSQFNVMPRDAAFLRTVDLRSVPKRYRAYSLAEFVALESRILVSGEMKTYIGKFVSRKLIFLHRYYGLPREDIENHLVCSALYALRKHYPRYEGELHALNICKTAIHNSGMGLIEFWTRDKRNAIKQGQGVSIALDSLRNVGVAPEHENELRTNLQMLVQLSVGLPPIQQRFLSAAAGLPDMGLSLFLGADNSVLADSTPYSRYLASLRNYYRIELAEQDQLLSSLRNRMV
jgi:hypothetical protein